MMSESSPPENSSSRTRSLLSREMAVAIVGAIATIVAALIGLLPNWLASSSQSQDAAVLPTAAVTGSITVPAPVQQAAPTTLPAVTSATASSITQPAAVGEAVTDEVPATVILFGDTVRGEISGPGSQNVYAFTAEPGQRIFIKVIESLSRREFLWRLVDERGQEIFRKDTIDWGDDLGFHTLDQGGTYQLIVGGSEVKESSTYAFSIKVAD